MTTSKTRAAALCALLAATSLAAFSARPGVAWGQDKHESAPPTDSTSPGGVSYGSGAFTYDLPVLSIGAGDFPQALQLTYQYRSDGARLPSTPWTTNMAVRTSHTKTDSYFEQGCPPYCNPGDFTWSWNIVAGHRSASFYKVGAGAGPGPYTATQLDGSSLTWESTGTYTGKFTYTSGDGAKIVFASMPLNSSSHAVPESWTEPDGTTITYGAASISTNRGVALYFEAASGSAPNYTRKICALNLTVHYLPSIQSCPSGVPTITIAGPAPGTGTSVGGILTSITNATGGTTNFGYGTDGGDGTDGHLICVKDPGQSACTISNTYDDCDGEGQSIYSDPLWNGSRDRVTQQSFATGETIAYSHDSMQIVADQTMTACRGNSQVTMTRGDTTTVIGVSPTTPPNSVQNGLGHVSTMSWAGPDIDYPAFTRLKSYTAPEGNSVEYTFDERGNVTETRRNAKSGSGLDDVVTSATFPSTCTYIRTCNKPSSVTDARGNTTTYTYDTGGAHGGVLTETGPAVGGVAPVKRYAYAQRYAWIKNAGGTYSQAASPVWVLTEERACRTTATSGNACAGGSTDELVTTFDYGPDSGPNNLWLRGTVTDPGGLNLRTCFTYDAQGNRIAGTRPKAGLASCS